MGWLFFLVIIICIAALIYVGWLLAVEHLSDEYEHLRLMRAAVEDDMTAMQQATGLMDAFMAARRQMNTDQ